MPKPLTYRPIVDASVSIDGRLVPVEIVGPGEKDRGEKMADWHERMDERHAYDGMNTLANALGRLAVACFLGYARSRGILK